MKTLTFLLLSFSFLACFAAVPAAAQLSLDQLPGFDRPDDDDDRPRPRLIPPEIAANLSDFMNSLGENQQDLMQPVRQVLSGFTKGEDLQALKGFDKLNVPSLTEDQSALLADARIAIDQYLLSRNFSDIPEFQGPLQDIMSAFQKGETEAVPGLLADMKDKATLSKEQRALLNELISQARSWY